MNDHSKRPATGPEEESKPHDPATPGKSRKPYPPDSIPDPMPGVDPQQTPGIDHLPAENERRNE